MQVAGWGPAHQRGELARRIATQENCFVEMIMTDRPITLDRHRGMAAQKATDVRRLLAEVEANEKSLRDRQEELEIQLVAAPAATWPEAAEKARYLLGLFASTAVAQDPRRKMLIANVLEDFVSLSAIESGKLTK
jgi:hypothetical protein